MAQYRPLYDPPLTDDIETLRRGNFGSVDQELYLHIGHFISWYGATEFMLGVYLQLITRSADPAQFQILTRGMDAGVKVERLRQACKEAGISIGPGLNARLMHFCDQLVPLRNKLVHNHLYWPEGKPLQICSIGTPPLYQDIKLPAADPEQIDGLTIFERGVWLNTFSRDLSQLHLGLQPPIKILERGHYHSPLPSGHHPSYPQQSARAKRRKQSQKPGPMWRALLNIRKLLRRWGLWPRQVRP